MTPIACTTCSQAVAWAWDPACAKKLRMWQLAVMPSSARCGDFNHTIHTYIHTYTPSFSRLISRMRSVVIRMRAWLHLCLYIKPYYIWHRAVCITNMPGCAASSMRCTGAGVRPLPLLHQVWLRMCCTGAGVRSLPRPSPPHTRCSTTSKASDLTVHRACLCFVWVKYIDLVSTRPAT